MMSRRQRAIFRAVARVLPRAFRDRVGGELEAAAIACIERERRRLGNRIGVVVAWWGIVRDLLNTAAALRRRPRRHGDGRGLGRDIFQEAFMPRLMRGHRGYLALAVASLSLSVGATLVVFTVVNALWLRPATFPEPDRLVTIVHSGVAESDTSYIGLEDAERWEMFEAVAGQVVTAGERAGQMPQLVLSPVGRDLETLGVTSRYFAVIGHSIRGRDFTRDDNRAGAEPVVIINDRLWVEAFDRRADIIGTVIPARPFHVRVIGVAPPGFDGARRGEHTDVWVPAALAARLSPAAATTDSDGGSTLMLARLRPGQTPEAARQLVIARQLASTKMAPGSGFDMFRETLERLQVVPLADVFGSPFARTIVVREGRAAGVVAGLAALVLLGSGATLMALVLVHYERRRRELSVRLALGASRRRLAAMLGSEFAWIAIADTFGAIAVAAAGLQVLPALSLPGGVDLGRLDLSLDWRVVSAAIALTTLTLATAVFLPLRRFTRGDLAGEIVAVRSTTPASSQHLRQTLLALHVAATIVVLVSAGLFVRAVVHGFASAPGFDVQRVVSVRLRFPPITGAGGEAIRAGLEIVHQTTVEIADAIRAQPGVDSVALGMMPIGIERMAEVAAPKTVETGGERRQVTVGTLRGAPGLVETLGLPVLSGRTLTADDDGGRGGLQPALVTASLARGLWPSGNAIGQLVSLLPGARMQVVGVIPDLSFGTMSQQVSGVFVTVFQRFGIVPPFIVRTERPDTVVQPIRRIIAALVPDAHRVVIETGTQVITRDLGRQRLGAWFFSGFGVISLVLGAGGVFGLVAYLAESRRREFGVRVALGAAPGELVRRGVAAGLVPVGIGAVAGLVAAALVARVFVSALPGLSALDPITYLSVALLMAVCAAGAGLAAAWRLRGVAPAEALRAE